MIKAKTKARRKAQTLREVALMRGALAGVQSGKSMDKIVMAPGKRKRRGAPGAFGKCRNTPARSI